MSLESYSAEGVCRVFASGKTCRFGKNCRFRHSQTNNEDAGLNGNAEDPAPRAALKRKVCSNYAKTRFCKFGAKCRFSHQIPKNFAEGQITDQHGILNAEENPQLGSSRAVNQPDKPYYSLPIPSKRNNASNTRNLRRNDPQNDEHGPTDSANPDGNDVRSTPEDAPRRGQRNVRGRRQGPRSGTFDARRNGQKKRTISGSAVDSQEHQQKEQNENSDVALPAVDVPAEESADTKPKKRPNRRRVCRYFKAGNCKLGKECKFRHPAPKTDEAREEGEEDKENATPATPKEEKVVFSRPNEFQLDDFMDGQAEKLRKKEVDQILKRYPKAAHVGTDQDGTWSCELVFVPTDPDWGFDVKELPLKVILPSTYPLMAISVLLSGEQERLPNTVIRYTGKLLKEWITGRFADHKSRGKGELMFLPFIRWLDRTLEQTLTDGLKLYRRELMAAAAGIQLISGAELQEEYAKKQVSSEDDDSSTDEEEDDSDDSEEYDDEFPPAQPSHVGELPPTDEGSTPQMEGANDLNQARKGTEVKFQKLELAENAATLKLRKVKLMIQCARCKNKAEVVTPVGKLNSVVCSKCSQAMLVMFRASMMHQFSAIAGYVDVESCTVFDLILIDSDFEVGCFNCNRDMRIEGLLTGQPKESFCRHCHKKFKISTESVRFTHLQAANVFDASDASILEAAAKKTKKLPKDLAIQLGRPLPGEGTCKHYKKSFRWLRFPCCGKAFPCDICHEDSEGDHEMARANRMICGFCCREQPYTAEKPCVGCGYNLVKKASKHWEGGKGCRDKVAMSRDDVKKFASMNKTMSRRAQAKKDAGKGKKNTKLRHS